MEVLVVRHVAREDIGHIGPAVTARGHSIAWRDLGQPIDIAAFGALVLMGGPMSVNDPDPWVAAELAVIQEAMRRRLPVLGICLGAQLVARALGATVRSNRHKEIGWFPVAWRPEAAADPLFHSFREPETLFHWHGETFDLPAGATWLASSQLCENQAFRYGANVYGIQFHPEVTPAMISEWLRHDNLCGPLREAPGPVDPTFNAARSEQVAATIFGRWAETFLVRA